MLQIRNICKKYQTGKLVQRALDDVSLNLRDNEFVAILGPSGSGKTTLLNMIGGLDRYDSGDLIINGVSTKKYKDRDWDSYRNHTIGFVFQSYNLIPHQTILANVELALTISGVGKSKRRQMAKEALEQVGLGAQVEKKPNQLSGGQMQRVAIARALVNNPDILLADEPTGALDSDTSVQVMDLLKEVAKDRLVVMVTHNPELAEEYATRIVRLKDGKIISDTDAFVVDESDMDAPVHRNLGKSSMSFLTALSLSFNNLKTKKARTLLTSFAGSIGIIGIALILALSTGVNAYIQSVEEETLSEYPLQIQKTGFDFTSMMVTANENVNEAKNEKNDTDEVNILAMLTNMFSKMDSNDLGALKSYLESGKSDIRDHVNAIEYAYDVTPQIFKENADGFRQVNPDTSFSSMGIGSGVTSNSLMSSMFSTDVFYELPENETMYKTQYEVKAGRWPTDYRECVVILTSSGSISDFLLYTLGLRDFEELDDMVQQFVKGEDIQVPEEIGTYTYQDILNTRFKLVNASDYYEYDAEYGTWKNKTDNKKYMRQLVSEGEDITIVGIIQPREEGKGFLLNTGIGYLPDLLHHVSEKAEKAEIVKRQLHDKNRDVFTGDVFGEEADENDFDMSSLFSVDEDALKNMFSFDMDDMASDNMMDGLGDSFDLSDAFSVDAGSMDLSQALDLNSIKFDLPNMPELNMTELMGNIKINASLEEVSGLAEALLTGYQEYSGRSIATDFWNLAKYFGDYLTTEEAKEILLRYMAKILQESDAVTMPSGDLQELLVDIMEGYQAYLAENDYTDPEKMRDYLEEYLQTPAVIQQLEAWVPKHVRIKEDLDIPAEDLKAMAKELTEGYEAYAKKNNLPDPRQMGEHFLEYLGSDEAQQMLTQGVMSMVDADALTGQITSALESYMGNAFTAFGSAIGNAIQSQISAAMSQITDQIASAMTQVMTQMIGKIQESLSDAFAFDGDAFAEAFQFKMDGDELRELLMSMGSFEMASYEGNLQKLGYVDFNVPTGIDIYPKDFESKAEVVKILDNYNDSMEAAGKEEQVITYTDMVGALMTSVTDIIDIISYVLIAFVAISLVVSSIMIGVITYISVLERKKEIGILRAIGASKNNVSQVFNAETCLIGLGAGLIGIGLTLFLLIPGNAVIHHFAGNNDVNAVLHPFPAIVLIILSVFLTFLGGLIPSRKASKSDPVTALRTE